MQVQWMNDEWVNEWVNEWWMNRQTCNKSLASMPVPSIDPVVTVIKGECYMHN